jgi:hypothetical protein
MFLVRAGMVTMLTGSDGRVMRRSLLLLALLSSLRLLAQDTIKIEAADVLASAKVSGTFLAGMDRIADGLALSK